LQRLPLLLIFIVLNMELMAETIIVDGTPNLEDAQKDAQKAKEILERNSVKIEVNKSIKLKKEGDIWLVKVKTPSKSSSEGKQIISELFSIFPAMVIIEKGNKDNDEADTTSTKPIIKEDKKDSNIFLDNELYWQWILLLILDIIGWIAYRKRRKRLQLLKESQDNLKSRQNSIWQKLQKEIV